MSLSPFFKSLEAKLVHVVCRVWVLPGERRRQPQENPPNGPSNSSASRSAATNAKACRTWS